MARPMLGSSLCRCVYSFHGVVKQLSLQRTRRPCPCFDQCAKNGRNRKGETGEGGREGGELNVWVSNHYQVSVES